MDFELTEQQQAVQRLARDFADREIRPHVEEWERAGVFPRDVARKMGELGFFGCTFPRRYGGSELGFVCLALICEEITRAYTNLSWLFNMCAMTVPFTILNWGTDAQRDRYVRKLITAEWIGAMGLTEADGGSDALGSMKTVAMRDGDTYILNGGKMFNTYAPIADLDLIYARTNPAAGHKGVSAFVVETSTPGFSSRAISCRSLGSTTFTGETSLQDCRVPAENLLGQEGQGFTIAMNGLDYGRITVAARTLGVAQACLDEALRYAGDRVAFGQPIGKFQMVQHRIADMVAEIEAARLLVYQCAFLKDKGRTASRESSIAKYYAAEVAARAASGAAELFGGYAWTDEYPINRLFNTAHFYQTGEGSANIQRIRIAEDALGWKKADRQGLRRPFRLESDLD